MPSASRIESVTQIPGIFAAHATNAAAGTGCTVIVCPNGATGGVDVRGGAPATRETDLLRPEETVEELHAVVLSGGSAFGLAASCGVAEELERRSYGLDVGVVRVPIVSGACLFCSPFLQNHFISRCSLPSPSSRLSALLMIEPQHAHKAAVPDAARRQRIFIGNPQETSLFFHKKTRS